MQVSEIMNENEANEVMDCLWIKRSKRGKMYKNVFVTQNISPIIYSAGGMHRRMFWVDVKEML